jgi:hypothetical protein
VPSRKTRATLDGIKFRSHTEYRWAVFFKELGIKARYEPQGFVTDGEPYLPDFVIFPALGPLWVEVKGDWEADPEGVAKWRRFITQRPQPSRAVLLSGDPTLEGKYHVIGGSEDTFWEDDAYEWRPCPAGYHFDLCYPGTFRTKFADDKCPDDFGGPGEDRLREAVEAALAHRFGKQPTGTAA